MTIDEAIKVLDNEQRCVIRNIGNRCKRDCGMCDLLLPDEDILSAYGLAISILRDLQETDAHD